MLPDENDFVEKMKFVLDNELDHESEMFSSQDHISHTFAFDLLENCIWYIYQFQPHYDHPNFNVAFPPKII